MGLTGYYRHFVQNYGVIARPLTQLLKKNNFVWGKEAMQAFQALKEAMTALPILGMPNFSVPFEVETDASGYGIGAVLMQQGKPLAFISQALSEKSMLKSVYERELMAIVFAMQKWRQYLLGGHFVIRTDRGV